MTDVAPATDVTVVTSGHDVADARIHRQVAELLRRGLAVEVRGLGDAADGPAGAHVVATPRPGLGGRALRALSLPFAAKGRALVTEDPEVALVAVALRRLHGRRVVVDVHEDYAALLRDRPWARGAAGAAARLTVRLATWCAQRADATVVADEHVPPRAARHRVVQRNLPDPSALPQPAAREPTPRAVYIGDLRASRGLFGMLDALEAAPTWTLDLVGPVAPVDAAALRQRLDGPLGQRVRLHGRLPPARAWRLAAGAWAGLALLEDTPAFREAEPTKVREYLACGLPIVVTDLPRLRRLADSSGAGVVVPTGADAGAQAGRLLAGWAAEPGAHAAVQQAARRCAEQERARAPYAPFGDAVQAVLGGMLSGR